jgi:hypothetical protein
LSSLNFNLNSAFFDVQNAEKYRLQPTVDTESDWKQLEIGENDSNYRSSTIYCGGSVSAVDWAPSNSSTNFLAVACNSKSSGFKVNIEKTETSCVQVYELANLQNEK